MSPEAKADLLLDLEISRYELYWVGNNGLFIPNLLWWSFAWAASGYVDDETYGGGIDMNVNLYSVHSNRKIQTWAIRKDVGIWSLGQPTEVMVQSSSSCRRLPRR